jgi:hypothetical protein
LDLRPQEDYKAAHIVSSLSLPAPADSKSDDADMLGSLAAVLRTALKDGLVDLGTQASPSVFVVNGSEPCDAFASFLFQQFTAKRANLLHLTASGDNGSDSDSDSDDTHTEFDSQRWLRQALPQFLHRLLTACQAVWCVKYTDFAMQFPMQCGPDVSLLSVKPMPLCLTGAFSRV